MTVCAVVASISASRALAGTLYVVDHADNDYVRSFDDSTGASINPTFVTLLSATGVAVGPDGYVYVGTSNPGFSPPFGSIFRYDPTTGAQIGGPFVVYNGAPPTPDPRDVINPQGMRFGSDNNLYIADEGGNGNVHSYDSTGTTAATRTPMGTPTSVAFSLANNLYAATSNGVEEYDPIGDTFNTVIQVGTGPNNISDVAFNPNDGKLFALDISSTPAVWSYNPDGSGGATFTSFSDTPALIFQPAAIAFGPDGLLYVSGADIFANVGEVLRFNANGSFKDVFATGLTNPGFLAFTPVPEPTGLAMGFIGMIVLARRRNRNVARLV